jgi:hypothetical protein
VRAVWYRHIRRVGPSRESEGEALAIIDRGGHVLVVPMAPEHMMQARWLISNLMEWTERSRDRPGAWCAGGDAEYKRRFDAATIRDVRTLRAHASQLSGAGAHGGASTPQRMRSSSCSTEATSSLRSMNERPPPPGSNDGTPVLA